MRQNRSHFAADAKTGLFVQVPPLRGLRKRPRVRRKAALLPPVHVTKSAQSQTRNVQQPGASRCEAGVA